MATTPKAKPISKPAGKLKIFKYDPLTLALSPKGEREAGL